MNSSQLMNISANDFEESNHASVTALGFTAYLLTGLVSIPGNALCLWILPKSRSIPENNRLFLMSLSMADLVVGMICILALPPALLNYWPYGAHICQGSFVVLSACSGISRNSLLGISIDRYIAITRPLHYHMLVTRRKIIVALVCIWMFGLFLTFFQMVGPPVVYLQHIGLCVPVWIDSKYRSQAITAFMVAFLIPCVIMFFIYGRLFQITRQQIKALYDSQNMGQRHGSESVDKATLRKKAEAKAVRMFCGITFTFLIAWCPYLTMALCDNLSGRHADTTVECFVIVTAMSSSWWDVVILMGMNDGFRRTTKRELARCCGCERLASRVEPSGLGSTVGYKMDSDPVTQRIEI